MKKIAEDAIENQDNLWIDGMYDGTIIKVFKTDDPNVIVSFTGSIVEVITIDNGEININNKSFSTIEVTKESIEEDLQISVESVMPGEYIQIPNPGGSWGFYSNEWIYYSTSNNFGSYTIGGLSAILGASIVGVPAAILLSLATTLITNSTAATTSVGSIERTILESLTFFKTYKITDVVYVLVEDVVNYVDTNVWWETWAPSGM
ncbi:MAG: hypothetical protein U9Q80_03180 [Bacillota bacterium]|nr:hypothetical protein [Bacillota bacterium]